MEAFHVCLYGLGVFECPFEHVTCAPIHAASTGVSGDVLLSIVFILGAAADALLITVKSN